MRSEPSDSVAEIPTEVELSAEDLLEMAPSAPVDQPTPSVASPVVASRAVEFVSEAAQPTPRARSMLSSKSLSPKVVAAVCIGVIAVAGTVIAAQYKASAQNRTNTFTRTSFEAPARIEEPQPEIVNEQPPVLFKNPFDATEVFEFPPGTSKDDARAAVADLLMKRAMERQAR